MLQQLARERCGLRVQGFGHPEDFPKPDRKYDFRDFVTPYTKGAGQVDSEIMIVLQDWSSADKLETQV